jgi:predicted flap endonuclease-1-like 5' DNA nuclease
MNFLNDILCKYPLLPWLLLPLLGLAIGWALWGKYKSIVADLELQISSLKTKIKGLEADLAGCRSHSAEIEGDLALAKGKLREIENTLTSKSSGSKIVDIADSKVTEVPSVSVPEASLATSFAATASTIVTSGGTGSTDKYAKLKSDNLQVIEGIGPKMDEVLKANGISSWSELAAQTPESIRTILDTYGDSYKIIDPATWPAQAKMAVNADYDGLIALQKNLDTGVADANNKTDSKLEKVMIKLGILKAYKQDDLKVIEGIGPKIAQLLEDAGIKTWAALSETSTDRIQEILNAAGTNFQLADPTSWPAQAGLAAEGKFKELEDLQDQLNGGK